MTATERRSPSGSAAAVSTPSHSTRPPWGRYSRHSSLARVVLPEPFSPTRATISPAPISMDTPVRAGLVALG
jgi:hypothetical protein